MRSVILVLCIALASSFARTARAQNAVDYGPGQPSPYVQTGFVANPQPTQTVTRSAPTAGLLIPGIILLAGGFGVGAIGSLSIESYGPLWTYSALIPIAGSWVQASEYGDFGAALDDGIGYFTLICGVAQAVGAVLTVLGLVIREEWEEATYVGQVELGGSLSPEGGFATARVAF